MRKIADYFRKLAERLWIGVGFGMRGKLIIIFILVTVIPLILLMMTAWQQFSLLGTDLKEIAVSDSAEALNNSAVENIERMTTDTAKRVADFLYSRDDDILYIAGVEPSEENYRQFIENNQRRMVQTGQWELAADGKSWVSPETAAANETGGTSSNSENNDMDGFHYRYSTAFDYENKLLYDEITFVDLEGNELIKVLASSSSKVNYPLSPELRNISQKENTYVKAESYFEELSRLGAGDIYVSDVIGAYVGSNYIGMYTPENVAQAAEDRGYEIEYDPESQSYAGMENPNGQRFEGIVRWATPVTDGSGNILGYVTLALNHDHLMEFVDHITPMNERYTELPNAFEGNYAFIWDYKCRSICHPRHHSIVGFDPETGDPQIPWLETSIYEEWQASGIATKWTDFIQDKPTFNQQSREKKPAASLTQQGLVGLDGRYLDNAPQCTGWMDLTEDGGSGSFYILWSGLYKLTTAAAIPYYTGQYAPSELNDNSKRGFGIVTIGAGLEDFTRPAHDTEERLAATVRIHTADTSIQLIATTAIIIVFVVLIAIWIASFLTNNITRLIEGVSRFRGGQRQFRFNATIKDEFGTLADSFDDMADSIVDSVKNPLSITDTEHKIIYMNDSGLAMRHASLDQIVGKSYWENSLYPVDTKYDPIKALWEGHEAEIYYLEDSQRYIKGVANYFLSKDGQKIGYIILTTDVTELVQVQLELEEAVKTANSANEHKGTFLARMSHEIRTPMNAIIGVTNIIQRKLDHPSQEGFKVTEIRDYVNQIESSSQHLLGLLNDILDLSKIEAGKIELSEETIELKNLMDTVVSIIKPRCSEKNITFQTFLDTFKPSTFISDSLRLRQVLINLLGNAVKFTPELGCIEFRVEKKDQFEGKTLIKFSVRDNGIGVSEESQATIFQSFEQGGNSISKQYGGTGLGLAISKNIVQLFGGDIELESELGLGSEFSFTIWLKETDSDFHNEEINSNIANQFTGKRALLVDDVEINRIIVISMLEETGLLIEEACNGLEAVKKFADSAENSYDIIFMDVQMPVMDGYLATEEIRKLDRKDALTVPIIALTANAFKEDIDKALQHGMNSHIAKPIEMASLAEVLYRFLKG